MNSFIATLSQFEFMLPESVLLGRPTYVATLVQFEATKIYAIIRPTYQILCWIHQSFNPCHAMFTYIAYLCFSEGNKIPPLLTNYLKVGCIHVTLRRRHHMTVKTQKNQTGHQYFLPIFWSLTGVGTIS